MMRLNEFSFKGTFRDYQQKVLDESNSYLEDGRIHVVAAPGSGKTTLGLEFICRLGKNALVLAPSITIRQQWGDRFAEDFLPEGEDPKEYVSNNISKPSAITCITYQALYSAMTGKEAKEDDEEGFEEDIVLRDDAERKNTPSRIDVAAIMRKKHITTICLDEAHHLRTEWHRSIINLLDELGDKVTIIALTATPPYDSTPAEWKKYISLCGPIDAEISIPQLVWQKTLCPHQDLVYFSYPTKEEQQKIFAFKTRASDAIYDVIKSGIFNKAFRYFIENFKEYDEDYLYEHIVEFRSFLYCAKKSGVELPKDYQNIISERKRIIWSPGETVQKGCQFVTDNPDLFGDEATEEMLDFFRDRHLFSQKKINLTFNKEISSLLASSMGKLRGIQTIVRHETENLGGELRMVILTDYVKNNLVKVIGSDEPLCEMGTVPIFESLRRENIQGTRLAILSGSLTIVPDESLPALTKIAKKEDCSVSSRPLRDTGFSRVEFSGGNKKKVRVVTELFRRGEINVMVGTKSLLGEGWDSPCINSLVLATFVGSFMLSNQMRGRAIRVDKDNPDKISNIWHLITPEINDGLTNYMKDFLPRYISEKEIYENSMLLGDDYEKVARRFECFMAPALEADKIQSGIDRLGIYSSMRRSWIESTNEKMLSLSSDREGAKDRWIRSIDNCSGEGMEICETNEFNKNNLPTRFGFINLGSYSLLTLILTLFWTSMGKSIFASSVIGVKLFTILVSLVLILVITQGIFYSIKLVSPKRLVEAIAKAMLSAFQKNGIVRSTNTRVEVTGDSLGLVITSTMRGGTLREKQLFAESMRELLSPMNNPRYVLLKRTFGFPQYYYSMSCPSLLGNNKQNAELFQKELERQIGDLSVLYARNEAGHKIYKKCVKASFVNFEVNSKGNIVRKEVY